MLAVVDLKSSRPGKDDSSPPLYRQVAAELRESMRAGQLLPGQSLPSLRKLAARWRTGVFTIRSAVALLEREGRVRTSPRRPALVRETRGRPDGAERRVLVVNTSLLGRLIASFYSARVLEGIGAGVDENGGSLLLLAHKRFKKELPGEILEGPLHGVLLFGGFTSAVLREYERLSTPVVLVDQPGKGRALHSVAVDNAAVGAESAERLLAAGHRRIAYLRYLHVLTGEPDPDDREREQAVRRVLAEAGLGRSALRIFNTYGDDAAQGEELRDLLREDPGYTAVIVGGLERARRVEAAARLAGREVPADLSVVAVGHDSPELARCSGPRVDFAEMGRRAAGLLSGPRSPARHLRVPVRWHPGNTLAPPSVRLA
jgi:DNA-binding LacI/PurR family transcriptional regulator